MVYTKWRDNPNGGTPASGARLTYIEEGLQQLSLQGGGDSGDAPTATSYGAKGDGVADDTAALTQFLSAGLTGGHIPSGVYNITQPLVLPPSMDLTMAPDATIRAAAPMPRMLATPVDTDVIDRRYILGILDCAGLAQTGLHIRFAHRIWIDGLDIRNSAGHSVIIGDNAAAEATGQVFITDFNISRGASDVVPDNSYGLWVQRAYDCHFTRGNVVGADAASVRADVGANYFTEVHAWGYVDNYPDVCFDDNADENYWLGCMADTPRSYSFRLRQFRTYLEGCHSYVNHEGADNAVVGIYLDKSGSDATVIGHFFEGDGGDHRLKSDFECAESEAWMPYVTVIGSRYQNVVEQNVSRYNFQSGAQLGQLEIQGTSSDLAVVRTGDGVPVIHVSTGDPSSPAIFYPNGTAVIGYADSWTTESYRFSKEGAIYARRVATGSRPSASALGPGAQIFDTTLNKPIWSNGSAWVDAAGTTV